MASGQTDPPVPGNSLTLYLTLVLAHILKPWDHHPEKQETNPSPIPPVNPAAFLLETPFLPPSGAAVCPDSARLQAQHQIKALGQIIWLLPPLSLSLSHV